jgi:hypothetical protein
MYDARCVALEERVRARFMKRRCGDHSDVARSEDVMDFIERLFGVAPDNGDGSIELLYFAAVLIVVGVCVFRKHLLVLTRGRRP